MSRITIAIDGYSSCGKSTLAKALAAKLNYAYIDSGAMYRCVTLYCLRNDIIKKKKFEKEDVIASLDKIKLHFEFNPHTKTSETFMNGENVEKLIRTMEVAENGDIANWKIPGKMVKGMGGAMDLVASAENIIVAMMHVNKAGESKILKKCSLPLTGVGCVKKVVTELAVLEITPKGFKLLERAPGVSVEHIIASTEADLIIEGEIPEMVIN